MTHETDWPFGSFDWLPFENISISTHSFHSGKVHLALFAVIKECCPKWQRSKCPLTLWHYDWPLGETDSMAIPEKVVFDFSWLFIPSPPSWNDQKLDMTSVLCVVLWRIWWWCRFVENLPTFCIKSLSWSFVRSIFLLFCSISSQLVYLIDL